MPENNAYLFITHHQAGRIKMAAKLCERRDAGATLLLFTYKDNLFSPVPERKEQLAAEGSTLSEGQERFQGVAPLFSHLEPLISGKKLAVICEANLGYGSASELKNIQEAEESLREHLEKRARGVVVEPVVREIAARPEVNSMSLFTQNDDFLKDESPYPIHKMTNDAALAAISASTNDVERSPVPSLNLSGLTHASAAGKKDATRSQAYSPNYWKNKRVEDDETHDREIKRTPGSSQFFEDEPESTHADAKSEEKGTSTRFDKK